MFVSLLEITMEVRSSLIYFEFLTMVSVGLIGVGDLLHRVQLRRGRNAEAIETDDIRRAIEKVKVLGNGFDMVNVGHQKMVVSVPVEFNRDHMALLSIAQVLIYIAIQPMYYQLDQLLLCSCIPVHFLMRSILIVDIFRTRRIRRKTKSAGNSAGQNIAYRQLWNSFYRRAWPGLILKLAPILINTGSRRSLVPTNKIENGSAIYTVLSNKRGYCRKNNLQRPLRILEMFSTSTSCSTGYCA